MATSSALKLRPILATCSRSSASSWSFRLAASEKPGELINAFNLSGGYRFNGSLTCEKVSKSAQVSRAVTATPRAAQMCDLSP